MFHCRVFAAKKLQTTEHLRVLPQNPLRKRKELQNEHGRLFELKVFLTGACKSTHAPELPSVLSFILSLQVQISCTRFGSCRRRCYSTRPIASTDSARVVANVLKYFAFTFHFSTLFFVEFSQRPHWNLPNIGCFSFCWISWVEHTPCSFGKRNKGPALCFRRLKWSWREPRNTVHNRRFRTALRKEWRSLVGNTASVLCNKETIGQYQGQENWATNQFLRVLSEKRREWLMCRKRQPPGVPHKTSAEGSFIRSTCWDKTSFQRDKWRANDQNVH